MDPEQAHVAAIAEQCPGFVPALAAVELLCAGLLSPREARRLTLVALATADPLIRADVLANLSDDVLELAAGIPADESRVLLQLSSAFDQSSHEIREALQCPQDYPTGTSATSSAWTAPPGVKPAT